MVASGVISTSVSMTSQDVLGVRSWYSVKGLFILKAICLYTKFLFRCFFFSWIVRF